MSETICARCGELLETNPPKYSKRLCAGCEISWVPYSKR